MRCCTQDQWQINYSPVHQKKNKKKKGKKKTSFNFITTISQWSWVKNAQINSGSTSKECFNVANGCEFCVKEEEERKKRKKREENFFSEEIDRSLFYSWVILAIGHDFVITSFIRVLTTIG